MNTLVNFPRMPLTASGAYKRLHDAIVKEEKGLEGLDDEDLDVLGMILIRIKAKDEMGRFGFFSKPREAAAVMGFFNPVDKSTEERLAGLGMPACAHEWRYLSCYRYWTQCAEVAAEMFRDERARTADGLSAMETKMIFSAWRDVFTELASKVMDIRVTFMRMAMDSGVSAAKAALSEVELAAQVGDYGNAKMAGVRAEYQSAYMHANMKAAAKAQAENKHSKKNTTGGAAPHVP